METIQEFGGFSAECPAFLADLAMNNETGWFNAHRGDYEDYVLKPSRAFVAALGERLSPVIPGIIADPTVNRSLFRINRDTRFRRDKSPYKTHLSMWFWEGAGPRMERSGFYFHLDPDKLLLAAGIHRFQRHVLETYREAVVHPKRGKSLEQAVSLVESRGFSIGGESYKRMPRGYDPGHRNARFLLFDGLHAFQEMDIPREFLTAAFVDFCAERFILMEPVHRWLTELIG